MKLLTWGAPVALLLSLAVSTLPCDVHGLGEARALSDTGPAARQPLSKPNDNNDKDNNNNNKDNDGSDQSDNDAGSLDDGSGSSPKKPDKGSDKDSGKGPDKGPPLELPADRVKGPHDRGFQAPKGGKGRGGAINLIGEGGRLQLCPTGNCRESLIDVTMYDLYEVDEDGNRTTNSVLNFASSSYPWSAVTTTEIAGANVTSSSFNASLAVNGTSTLANFEASVHFYQGNSTIEYIGEELYIPDGSMKFSLRLSSWPFQSIDNKLRVGLRVFSRNKKGNKSPKGKKEKGKGRNKAVERLVLQDSMFLDSPSVAEVDGSAENITTILTPFGEHLVIEYEFPEFNSLYYDPVMTSEEDLSTNTTTDTSESPAPSSSTEPTSDTPTPSPTTPSPSDDDDSDDSKKDGKKEPPLDLPADFKPGKNDHSFKAPKGRKSRGGGFSLVGEGGRIRLCPTGDCRESLIDVTMLDLFEVDASGNETKNVVPDFSSSVYAWQPIVTEEIQGANVTSSTFDAQVTVNGTNTNATMRARVEFYQGNGSTEFANTTIDVPDGSLKFALWIEDWPFEADSNKLRFGIRITSRNKKGEKKPKGEQRKGEGKKGKIDRLILQDSMFLDSPSVAEVDGVPTDIQTLVKVRPDRLVLHYEFPKFKKLYYDPVMTSEEDVSTTTTPAPAESASPSPTTAAPSPTPTDTPQPTNLRSSAVALGAYQTGLLGLVPMFCAWVYGRGYAL